MPDESSRTTPAADRREIIDGRRGLARRPGPDSIASAFGYWVPLLLASIGWLSYRRVRNARRAYWALAPSERELVVKALLFVVHNGAIEKGQHAPGYARKPALVLADLLDLNRHTVDEGLRRLIEHGYLGGSRGASAWTLTTHIELTAKGHSFYDRHFGRTGGVYDLRRGAPSSSVPLLPNPVRREPDHAAPGKGPDDPSSHTVRRSPPRLPARRPVRWLRPWTRRGGLRG